MRYRTGFKRREPLPRLAPGGMPPGLRPTPASEHCAFVARLFLECNRGGARSLLAHLRALGPLAAGGVAFWLDPDQRTIWHAAMTEAPPFPLSHRHPLETRP